MVWVHGEQKEKEYKFDKCEKGFDGYNLLQKHIKSGQCDTEKNFECDRCTPSKWFTKKDSMVTYIKTFHTGKIIVWIQAEFGST